MSEVKTKTQYKLCWKRKGLNEKRKLYWSERAAKNRITLMGPEPWKALDLDPDSYACCSGGDCGCGGETVREYMLRSRGDMPPLEYASIESREVSMGAWGPKQENEVQGE